MKTAEGEPTQNAAPVQKKWRRPLIITIGLLIVSALLIANWPTRSPDEPSSQQKTDNSPDYQTVLPSGSSIKELGGWKKLSPPKGSPFYSYNDSIDGVAVNVSQQQLPKDFQANTNERVAELAKNYNATKKLTVNGTTVYIGSSAKGPQSVIFTQGGLLILIMSEDTISDANWEKYINSLGTPSSTSDTTY